MKLILAVTAASGAVYARQTASPHSTAWNP